MGKTLFYSIATVLYPHLDCVAFIKFHRDKGNQGVGNYFISIFLKKRSWSTWVSNLGPQNGRRRRNHGAMAVTNEGVGNYTASTSLPILAFFSFEGQGSKSVQIMPKENEAMKKCFGLILKCQTKS